MTAPIIELVTDWRCPGCGETKRTQGAVPNVYHHCPKTGGLTTPFVRAGTAAKVEIRLREDYVGREKVRLDDQRRPVQAVITTRDNGQDVTVFAPTAQGSGEVS